VGCLSAAAAARFLRNLLFRIEPLDPMSLGAGALIITVVALAATLLPARRAARVDPLTALRD
jgi:ABC-type lipoprotein release transport system permease subunit